MGSPVTRYFPARCYPVAGFAALFFSVFSAWAATRWLPSLIPTVLFLLSSAALFFLAARPAIALYHSHIAIGSRRIPWEAVRRVDTTDWISPLMVLRLTLADGRRVTVVYPGDADSANSLHRQIRRSARHASIDGQPYREYWGEPLRMPDRAKLESPRYRVLTEEDEAEVEALYQKLKTVGRLDPSSSEEDS